MSTKLNSLWESLKTENSTSGFRRFDASHPLDFYLGIDSDGRRVLLLICKMEPAIQSELKAVRMKIVEREDGRWSLFLILEDLKLLELFSLLCEDLIEASRHLSNMDHSLSFVLKRLSSWRQLFEKGDLGLLPESKIRGLCGELVYLLKLINLLGEAPAVAGWVGPYMADQDFQFEDKAWEIKTVRPGGSVVNIASEKQLDTTIRDVDLVVLEVGNCASSSQGSFTLNSLVRDVQVSLVSSFDAKSEFERSLFRAGYIFRSEYDALNMVVRGSAIYEVGHDFPRIVASNLPCGVSNASYQLDLTTCESFKYL